MVCFQATGITLFELKPDSTPIKTLPLEGKVTSFREFSNSVQLIVNEDQLWLWSPTLEREKKTESNLLELLPLTRKSMIKRISLEKKIAIWNYGQKEYTFFLC